MLVWLSIFIFSFSFNHSSLLHQFYHLFFGGNSSRRFFLLFITSTNFFPFLIILISSTYFILFYLILFYHLHFQHTTISIAMDLQFQFLFFSKENLSRLLLLRTPFFTIYYLFFFSSRFSSLLDIDKGGRRRILWEATVR